MEYIMAKIGSINNASMFKKLLQKRGFDAYVAHTPPSMNKGGCSYSVKFSSNIFDAVKRTAAENNIKIKGFYADKGGEYYDIS